jgi:predicted metal-dependent peptidase
MTAEHIYTLLPESEDGKNPNEGEGEKNSPPNPDPGGDGGVSDSPNSRHQGSSQSQEHAEEAEWKIAVAQAAHVAKQQGKLPGDIERMLEELFEPVLPWRELLWKFATEKSNGDFSWKRGNRRFIAQGLYLPSRVSDDSMGILIVVIDASGSVTVQQITEFGSEVSGIHKEVRPSKLYVLYCDAKIRHIDEFGPDDELHFGSHGGGGTDFRPPFAWVEAQGIEPKALIYLTDGYGPFPEESTFPVMWCINNHDVVPPHGEHLVLEI